MRTLLLILILVAISPLAQAQQVTVGNNFHRLNDSFYERMGVGWSGNWRGLNFSYGGNSLALPPFGGYNPSADLTGGVGVSGPHGRLNMNFNFGQGYQQGYSTVTPMATMMNGQSAYVGDTSITPFVVSVVPVVGANPMFGNFAPVPSPSELSGMAGMALPQGNPRVQAMRQARADAQAAQQPDAGPQTPAVRQVDPWVQPINPPPRRQPAAPPQAGGRGMMNVAPEPVPAADPPAARLAAAQASSAGRAAPSVAEARRMHAAEQGNTDDEARAYFERGQAAEEAGKPGLAKIYYQMAVKRAAGELKEQIQQRLEAVASGQQAAGSR